MKILEFIMKVQQIAKIGLLYSKDPYAIENYENLEKLSREMLNESNENLKLEKNIFKQDIYPTPSSSVRVLVFNENNELLMVKEKEDGGWAVPGGWCEIYCNLSENARKEVLEEAGLEVEVGRLLAIFRRELYKNYPAIASEYVHYFVARIVGGSLRNNHETSEVAYFKLEDLPPLSLKNSERELSKVLQIYKDNLEVYVD